MILIREAIEEDAEPLAKLATELGYKTTKDDVAKRFSKLKIKVGHHIYVAVEKKVVGFISFEHYENDTFTLLFPPFYGWIGSGNLISHH